MKCSFVENGGMCCINGRDYSCYFPGCSRECEHHPERVEPTDIIGPGIVRPIVSNGVWNPGTGLRTETGIDAAGHKVERRESREIATSGGGDSIRDGETGKVYFTGKTQWGAWEIV